MGRRLTASEETALLQATVREAHEATQGLRDSIRDALMLTVRLVDDFQAIADAEVRDFSNHLQTEINRQSAELNAAVDKARDVILHQLTATEMIIDKENEVVRLKFPPGKFDDNQRLPYPHIAKQERTQ